VAQHLFLRYLQKGGYLHRFRELHLALAFEHARDRRRGEAQVAGEIGLRGVDAIKRLFEPS
jgi:hypothetical protein